MKKSAYITFAFIFLVVFLKSQSCLPEGIVFSSQSQIDSFQFNHPYCTQIEGNVLIEGNDIQSLQGLDMVISMQSNLTIINNLVLEKLIGLENLDSIGGDLSIGDHSNPNNNLNTLEGLDNLQFVGGKLDIDDNPLLNNISALNSLTLIGDDLILRECVSLKELNGLESLTSVGGEIDIMYNDSSSLYESEDE